MFWVQKVTFEQGHSFLPLGAMVYMLTNLGLKIVEMCKFYAYI